MEEEFTDLFVVETDEEKSAKQPAWSLCLELEWASLSPGESAWISPVSEYLR